MKEKDPNMMKQLEDIRTRLMGKHSPEELNLMKVKIDALEGLRRLDAGQHDDDTDEEGHHHHEHVSD